MVEELHETHPGICGIKALPRSYVWWPKMDADLDKKVRQCSLCKENRKSPSEAALHPWKWLHKPWVRFILPMQVRSLATQVIVIDAHSKWI